MALLSDRLSAGQLPGLRYGFPALMAARLGCEAPSPGSVKRFFDERGLVHSKEQWRLWLSNPPRRPDLITWTRIAHTLGVNLSELIDYEPTGEMPPARPQARRPRERQPSGSNEQTDELRPPDPRDYFRSVDHA